MRNLRAMALSFAAAFLPFLAPAPAQAVECDQLATGVGICLPRYGTDGDQWGTSIINAFTLLNGSVPVSSSSTQMNMGQINVSTIASINSSGVFLASFTVANSSMAFGYWNFRSTFTATGNLELVQNSTIATHGTLTISTAISAALTGTPAIFIDIGGKVQIGGAAPISTFGVVGSFQAGTGMTQATITATGNLQLPAGSTLTTGGGSISFSTATSAGTSTEIPIFIGVDGLVRLTTTSARILTVGNPATRRGMLHVGPGADAATVWSAGSILGYFGQEGTSALVIRNTDGNIQMGLACDGSTCYVQSDTAFPLKISANDGAGQVSKGWATFDGLGGMGVNTNNPRAVLHVTSGTSYNNTMIIDGDDPIPFQIGATSVAVNSDGQVRIGSATVPASVILFTSSTAKGVLFSPMNSTQRDAISSPEGGTMIYNVTTKNYEFYTGTAWSTVGNSTGAAVDSNNTFTGTNIFNSTVTFSGSVSGTINQSTFTLFNANISITGTAMGPCLAGSTVSFTLANASKVNVSFSGALDADNSTSNAVLGFLIDGEFPTGTTSALGLAMARDRGAGFAVPEQVAFRYKTRTTLTAASHSFCLTAHGGSGSSAVLTCDSSGAACNFEVEEFH